MKRMLVIAVLALSACAQSHTHHEIKPAKFGEKSLVCDVPIATEGHGRDWVYALITCTEVVP